MYDYLVKRLWECASGECFNCSQYTETTNASVCSKELMKQAADVIEELQKALDAVNDAHDEGYDVGYLAGRRDYEPKWIPVTERLPEERLPVLVVCQNGSVFVAEYYWTKYDGTNWVTRGPLGSGRKIGKGRVTHWMPLPQPPKEVDA